MWDIASADTRNNIWNYDLFVPNYVFWLFFPVYFWCEHSKFKRSCKQQTVTSEMICDAISWIRSPMDKKMPFVGRPSCRRLFTTGPPIQGSEANPEGENSLFNVKFFSHFKRACLEVSSSTGCTMALQSSICNTSTHTFLSLPQRSYDCCRLRHRFEYTRKRAGEERKGPLPNNVH